MDNRTHRLAATLVASILSGSAWAQTPDLPRAMPPAEVAAAARDLGLPAEVAPTVAAGVRRGREVAAADDLVLVTGSLYTVGAARTALAAG